MYFGFPVEAVLISFVALIVTASLAGAIVTLEWVLLYAVVVSASFDEGEVGEVSEELVEQHVLRGGVEAPH